MPEIQTAFLFTIDLDFEFSVLGDTPYGMRRIARLKSGNFDGPTLKGTVLPGGGAWTLVRRDGVLDIEVRHRRLAIFPSSAGEPISAEGQSLSGRASVWPW